MNKRNKQTLDQLRNNYQGKIYIWFSTEKVFKEFLKDAENQGYLMGGETPTKSNWPRDILSLGFDKKIYACNTISHMAFNEGSDVTRVDYEKFARGDEHYLMEGEQISKIGYKANIEL